MASEKVFPFTDLNFKVEVLQSPVPVLVDFSAVWCGPCRAIAPIIDQLANELDWLKVGKMDIDESPVTAAKYEVRGVPTIMIFRDGESISQYVGLTSKKRLLDLIKDFAPDRYHRSSVI